MEDDMNENKDSGGITRVRLLIMMLVLVLVALLTSGCEFMGFWTKKSELKREMKRNPSVALGRELTPENAFAIYGHFKGYGERKEPLLIAAVSRELGKPEIVMNRILFAPAAGYSLGLLKGAYDVFLVADLDGNGFYDQNEVVGRTPADSPLIVSPDRSSNGVAMDGPVIALDFGKPRDIGLPLHVKTRSSGYLVNSLDEEFFDPRYGILGLWDIKEFMDHTQGVFFGLEEFDPAKTIVIFVHGVTGTPRDWKYLANHLDRSRFQPWFYYYPSGMPLEKLGSHLASIVRSLDSLSNGTMDRVVIVAHSMGGLVSRAAINDLCRNGAPPFFKLYISLSTPYGGVDSAKKGVEQAPVVVPSWRDVAPGSAFLDQLYQRPFPANVPFHLFFGFHNDSTLKGECSDSTIVLRSQLDHRAQDSAVRVYGFDDTHTGILEDVAVMNKFNGILESVASQKAH
jgi:pimeloyl-ACP methyl ester carboxylesterase